ncbi:hypothetical protein ACTNBL_01750 [Enterococcus villorum]|uniref:Uncharacterized protein n=2 Tax=Enterococcus villorum TaxID=112904 RepID=A0A511J2R6_9ENTE|nr:hypothetical protein [Enterococcus villorum]EOH92121.1 hypothetical protein UAO_00571 [Enterococcus villorum ATCC 700913]EOW76617.1 hypothetical protein I591_01925 [Enterococcus villorum ATCC 700913]GEL92306.1 hypothetical protein EVI01_16430 [Enterococcus villorum]
MSTNKNNSILNTKKASIKIPSKLREEYNSVSQKLDSIDKFGQNIKKWDEDRTKCIKGNVDKEQLTLLQEQRRELYTQLKEIIHDTKEMWNGTPKRLQEIMEPRFLHVQSGLEYAKKVLPQKIKTLSDRLLTPEQRTLKDQIHAARKQSQLKKNMNHEISRRAKNKMNGLEKR